MHIADHGYEANKHNNWNTTVISSVLLIHWIILLLHTNTCGEAVKDDFTPIFAKWNRLHFVSDMSRVAILDKSDTCIDVVILLNQITSFWNRLLNPFALNLRAFSRWYFHENLLHRLMNGTRQVTVQHTESPERVTLPSPQRYRL